MKAEEALKLITAIGIPAIIVLVIVIIGFCVCNVDKLLQLTAAVQKLFSFISKKARKGTISNSIRGNIIKSSKAFRSMGNDLMIKDLKIDWVSEETPESFIKNNQVIIRMSQSSNPYKNYVTAVNTYVGQALLPKAKRYIDSKIMEMSQLSVSRLLVLNGDYRALDYFDDNVLYPIIDNDSDAEEILDRLKIIDKNGMFINILLNEYAKAAQKIYPDLPDPLLVAESKELLTYLYRIAMRVSDDPEELKFNREYFKIHIFLTANSLTYKRSGLRPYLKHMGDSLSEGIETIYVFGLGRKIDIAKEISDAFSDSDYRVSQVVSHYYRHKSINDGKSVRGVCYELCVYQKDDDLE